MGLDEAKEAAGVSRGGTKVMRPDNPSKDRWLPATIDFGTDTNRSATNRNHAETEAHRLDQSRDVVRAPEKMAFVTFHTSLTMMNVVRGTTSRDRDAGLHNHLAARQTPEH